VLTFVHSIFEHAIDCGLIIENPVPRAPRPGRRREGANPDLQFLTVEELDAVIRAIPDDVVVRTPRPARRGRPGPAPPPPADVLGPVLRVLILAAATTGLRQSELLGLRWRDVDWTIQRLRVRSAFVRGAKGMRTHVGDCCGLQHSLRAISRHTATIRRSASTWFWKSSSRLGDDDPIEGETVWAVR
jgi:integrase